MTDLTTQIDHTHSALQALAVANLQDSTKAKYRRAILAYTQNGRFALTDTHALAAHAQELSSSGQAFLSAAVSLWASAMMQQVKATPAATADEVAAKQEMLWRLESLKTAVPTTPPKGEKAHTWLTRAEVIELLDAAAGTGTIQQRNRLTLALLVAAGLRREEAVNLQWADVKQQPVKNQLRTVLQIRGKGAKNRVVPISDKLAAMLETWAEVVGSNGHVLRAVSKGGVIGKRLSTVGLFQIVRKVGTKIDKPALAPHDLRRTYAQIGYESGVPIAQISKLLGHSSVATTQRYLNPDLDLETTISDFVPL